jgi:hypothetical protein
MSVSPRIVALRPAASGGQHRIGGPVGQARYVPRAGIRFSIATFPIDVGRATQKGKAASKRFLNFLFSFPNPKLLGELQINSKYKYPSLPFTIESVMRSY